MPFAVVRFVIGALNEERVEVLRFDVRGEPGSDDKHVRAQTNLRTARRLQLGCGVSHLILGGRLGGRRSVALPTLRCPYAA
jgi:hypothetical protein